MVQLQDAQKEAEVTSEATERELELEAQLVEARSIIQEQVLYFFIRIRLVQFNNFLHSSLILFCSALQITVFLGFHGLHFLLNS